MVSGSYVPRNIIPKRQNYIETNCTEETVNEIKSVASNRMAHRN